MSKTTEGSLIILSWMSVLIALAVVFSLIGFLFLRGAPALSVELFVGESPLWPALSGRTAVWDGIWPACVGTFYLVGTSSLIALPIGILSGIYLAQLAEGRLKNIITFAIDVLASVPSIVVGLFGFALILFLRKTWLPEANTCLLLSAFCISLLVLPYLIHTTQRAIEALPESLKLVGPSLGLSPSRNVLTILLPAASRGILSGVILCIGRAAEDTAVILMTGVVANAGLPGSFLDKYQALPFFIYYTAAEHNSEQQLNQGFGAGLVLLCITTTLFVGAHLIQRTLERTWRGSTWRT